MQASGHLGKTKIAQKQRVVSVQKDVFGLEVAVYHVSRMQILLQIATAHRGAFAVVQQVMCLCCVCVCVCVLIV